ncbi:hypothetical protein [Prosthecobacter debontii]|uniref:hypothetical protein n=1 Tax=Prosthecobacter debontii TaxID=48467 RepID=UPI00159053D2|nr:hypothetical protein [Prosthecobacter debontii]
MAREVARPERVYAERSEGYSPFVLPAMPHGQGPCDSQDQLSFLGLPYPGKVR